MSNGVTLVTGASGGLGTRLVDFLLAGGTADVVCQYRSSRAPIEEIVKRHGLDPAKHLIAADLTDENAVRAMREAVEERFGRVWGIVNLAGINTNAVSWKMTLADFRAVLEGNLVTTFLTCREFIPGMREAGGGRIINVASVVAHVGAFGASHYAASKSAIIGFTRSLAVELASKNVTANSLSLGYFAHGIINQVPPAMLEQIKQTIPTRRLGEANEFAGLVRFLLGDDAAYITGQTIHVNGGQYS